MLYFQENVGAGARHCMQVPGIDGKFKQAEFFQRLPVVP